MDKAQYSRETNKSEKLAARLAINQKTSAIDFQQWLQDHIELSEGSHVLDVACGTGAQTLRFLKRVGQRGSVSAIDVSSSSIEHIRKSNSAHNLVAEVGDMMQLTQIIHDKLPRKTFDLISCTYALYYASSPQSVLDSMLAALRPGGKLAVCVPNGPHGLVELVRAFATIPAVVDESLDIGARLVEPFVASHFETYSVSHLRNKQTLESVAEVMGSLENAPYFRESNRMEIEEAVAKRISSEGAFVFYKKSSLIVAEIGGSSDEIREGK